MDTPTTAEDIVALNLDLPIYMLEQMTAPGDTVLDQLIGFLDHRMALSEDPDTYWDLRMGNALAVLVTAQHPDALALCCEVYNWLEESSPFLQHKLLRLLETGLAPEKFEAPARRWLKSLKRGQDLHLPLTILVSRSGHVDEELQALILDYWKHDPPIGAHLMALTKHDVFLELVEQELTWLAPFVRYLPQLEAEQTRLMEHDMWSEMAEAWFAIAHHNRPTPAWLNPAFLLSNAEDVERVIVRHREWQEHLDHHLMDTFGGTLPWSSADWLANLGNAPEFARWRSRFVEAQEVYQNNRSSRRGLRLVRNTEAD